MFQLGWKLCLHPEALWHQFIRIIRKGKRFGGKQQKELEFLEKIKIGRRLRHTPHTHGHCIHCWLATAKQSVFIGVNKYWLQKYSSGNNLHEYHKTKICFLLRTLSDYSTSHQLSKPEASSFLLMIHFQSAHACTYTRTHTLTHTESLKHSRKHSDPQTQTHSPHLSFAVMNTECEHKHADTRSFTVPSFL